MSYESPRDVKESLRAHNRWTKGLNHERPHGPSKNNESGYQIRSRLIHGRSHSARWDYDHHVVPPMTASVTFRLDSVRRGAQGFEDFAHGEELGHAPIYVYDRLGQAGWHCWGCHCS